LWCSITASMFTVPNYKTKEQVDYMVKNSFAAGYAMGRCYLKFDIYRGKYNEKEKHKYILDIPDSDYDYFYSEGKKEYDECLMEIKNEGR